MKGEVEKVRAAEELAVVQSSPQAACCEECAAAIEAGLLLIDPAASLCIECLTAEDRRRLERDLTTAGEAQRALLPPVEFESGDWQIAYAWRPAGPVSGDHVDLIPPAREGDPTHLMLGDVAGKGVTAALLQSRLHALFNALAVPELAMCALLDRTNRLIARTSLAETYATLVAMRLHGEGRIELVNAGHPRPLVADRRGVRAVEGSDLPLGMFAEAEFTGRELDLAAGSTLLLFTDGVSEAVDEDGEEFGIGRTAAAFRRARDLSLPELLISVRGEVEEWCSGNHGDDVTLVAVRRGG